MKLPSAVPVMRIEDYHTHHIGTKSDGGLFMAFVTSDGGPLNHEALGDEKRSKKWFSVLHHFERNGKHVQSSIETHGTTPALAPFPPPEAVAALTEKLNMLGKLTYENIAIQQFRVEHDGCVFGLLTADECNMFDKTEDDAEMQYRIYLVPNDIVFYPPWTGDYET